MRRTIRPARTRSTGFKRFFKGEIVGEVYTRLDQTDYAPEMAQIRAAKPDVVFHFHPGGLGIAFTRQYQQAGLLGTIPMVVASPSIDVNILKAVGEAALGINGSTHWNSDFDNPANKKFMAEWTKKYGADRLPTYYASQGYDTALAIGAALKAVERRCDGHRAVPHRRCSRRTSSRCAASSSSGPTSIRSRIGTRPGRKGR